MDKVELSQKDIEMLLEWRDKHKSLVRALPAPLRAVEICFSHNDVRIKGIRDGQTLKLHISAGYKKLGSAEFCIAEGRNLHLMKKKLLLDEADFQSALTVYCSVMALMAYGSASSAEEEEPTQQKPTAQRKETPALKQQNRTTYILRKTKSGLQMMRNGAHASPQGVFTVRGHYRNYKSGKVVWVNEYKKGTGKKKSKTYKLRGK